MRTTGLAESPVSEVLSDTMNPYTAAQAIFDGPIFFFNLQFVVNLYFVKNNKMNYYKNEMKKDI